MSVVADGTDLVLGIKHPPVNEDDIAWEHRLVHVLSGRLDEVFAPIVARAWFRSRAASPG